MTTDTLTDDGIKSTDAMVTLSEYRNLHGEPVIHTDNRVVFRDETGNEISDWADALGVSYGTLHQRLHELAREVYDSDDPGDPWGVADPIVFDAETFE